MGQARVDALGFEGSERDNVCAAIEEKRFPTGELVIPLSIRMGQESVRTLKMTQQ